MSINHRTTYFAWNNSKVKPSYINRTGYEPKANDPPEHLLNILDGKAALLLIARLPISYQKVMRMKYVQDLSLKEMSLITGQTKNALAVQLHRGLEKLKIIYKT